jgi:hypothetical protein
MKRRIFLMYGQSNMCDRGWAAELPAFANSDRMFVYTRVTPVGVAEIGTHGTWQPAVDVIDPAGTNPGQVGALALAFMNRMCELYPDDEIGVVPRSQPGTGIDTWKKWNRISGNYGMALERVWWALDELPAGVDGEIAGALWWQGEGDAASANASLWCERFSHIVSDTRVDLQNLNLPIVFVRLGNDIPSGMTYWNTVRQQQDWMTMRNLAKVSIDDVVPLSDKTHYPTAGYITIGTRMADAMAPML